MISPYFVPTCYSHFHIPELAPKFSSSTFSIALSSPLLCYYFFRVRFISTAVVMENGGGRWNIIMSFIEKLRRECSHKSGGREEPRGDKWATSPNRMHWTLSARSIRRLQWVELKRGNQKTLVRRLWHYYGDRMGWADLLQCVVYVQGFPTNEKRNSGSLLESFVWSFSCRGLQNLTNFSGA